MEDPLSGRAPEPLENVISKSVARPPPLTTTAGPRGRGSVRGACVVGPCVLTVVRAPCPLTSLPSVCLSVRACRVGGRPVSLAKWWRHLEVVPSPVLSLWRCFSCNLKPRRGCAAGIFAPHVRGPPLPVALAPPRCFPVSLADPPSCSGPPSSLSWPRPPGAWPREVGKDTGPRPRSRWPVRSGLARVAVTADPEHLVRSSPGMELPPGMEPPQAGTSHCFPSLGAAVS